MTEKYQKTLYACFIGYITQAIINNFAPLLFITFQNEFNISLSKVTLMVTFNFGVQLFVDFISVSFVDRIGYRLSVILAHVFAVAGIAGLVILPGLLPSPFIGLLLSVMIYAVGGGIIEVLISPIVEACPTEHKEKTMSLLHSFYCWGQVGVVLISSIFFRAFGIGNWRIMALIWLLIPLFNIFLFMKVPIITWANNGPSLSVSALIKQRLFWLFVLLMFCAGASEMSVSQWASTFAEQGLGVDKTLGDLLGPMFFAILMGTSRAVYGKYGHLINLDRFMIYSGMLCILSYIVISLSPWPLISLIACGICGLSVGIMWPGTFSMAAASIKGGQTAMFAYLALAGDLGCMGGPSLVGFISGVFNDNLKTGILTAVVFPLVLVVGIIAAKKCRKI